eukprot:CAMPEP_0202687930 /NCGR_PEP_ID=MMETSP1385-20130828/3479_1 /ASSEMBLY_ACC=CAM_ASM_000861 /TAXON_ID=933848 /ORGANISM="Elphidium margaritaceum" /LENGTH=469 /DNA_ID=CAMNT_0049342791 /DNA_START=33 /DNA_END=1442 /DNA_ORIENTATION=+
MGGEQSSSAKLYTHNAEKAWTKSDIIPISIDCGREGQRVVHALYAKNEKLRDVLHAIKKASHPLSVEIWRIKPESFTGSFDKPEDDDAFLDTLITKYDKKRIVQQGLKVELRTLHRHQIKGAAITCPEMLKGKTCPIYAATKQKYAYTPDNLKHLEQYTHFGDKVGDKPLCKYGDECNAFKRMENGGNQVNDRCHFKLYLHPPRARILTLSQNMHAFVMNTARQDNHDLYEPTYEDYEKYKYTEQDGFLLALVEEVIRYGDKNDLCTKCGSPSSVYGLCQHKEHSILAVVDEKMKHKRHQMVGSPLRRDEMLALVLYTGCECNYNLCRSQRNGNYLKWKWFDRCLWDAIAQLSSREKGAFAVYSGVSKVKMPKKSVQEGYFTTYVSTSWKKEVAQSFMKGQPGMIIQLDEQFKEKHDVHCCDVSWVSKFEDAECEVLFARSLDWNKAFEYEVIDESNGIQTVMVKLSSK